MTLVQAPADRVPREGESLFRSGRPDYKIDPATGCWLWQKSLLNGYPMGGSLKAWGTSRAHRLYWARANGPIPANHDVHHKCLTPACVNPDHLEAVPARDHDVEHFLNRRGISFETIRAIRAEGRKPGVQLMDTAARFGVASATVQFYWDDRQGRWSEFLNDGPVGRPGVTCLLEECDVVFVPKRRDGKFCCDTHRARQNARDARRRARTYWLQKQQKEEVDMKVSCPGCGKGYFSPPFKIGMKCWACGTPVLGAIASADQRGPDA